MATSASGKFTFDDQLLLNANALLSHDGRLFSSSTEEINVVLLEANYARLQQTDPGNVDATGISFTLAPVAAVPEPASTLLIGFALTRRAARR